MNGRTITLAITGILVCIIGISAFWWSIKERSPRAASEPAGPVPQVASKSEPAPAPQPTQSDSSADEVLKRRIAAEQRMRQKVEEDNAALRAQLGQHAGEVIVSFGKVEDIGKRTGAILRELGELQELSSREAGTLTADERHRLMELQRNHATVEGMLPEITGFQDSPAEYGRFFRSMLQEAGGLTDAQATQVESLMTQRATAMNQLGLNDGNKPSDPTLADQWETKRDEYNEETANGLIAILPSAAVKQSGFSSEVLEFLEQDFDKAGIKKPQEK